MGQGETYRKFLSATATRGKTVMLRVVLLLAFAAQLSGCCAVISLDTQSITFPTIPSSLVYGALPITLGAMASSKLAVAYTVTGPASLNGSTLIFTGAGTVVVTASQAGNSDYVAATPVSQTVTVMKAPLTVTITNQSVSYNMPLPILSGFISGVVNGDNISAAYSTTASSTSAPGTYPITAMLAPANELANYAVNNPGGTLTILQAAQTITFPTLPATVVYGAAPITLSAAASSRLAVGYSVSGPASLNGSTLAFTGVGTVLVTATQPGNADYLPANSVPQAITVTKASLIVTVADQTVSFGAAFPMFTGTISGAVNGEIISAAYSTTASATSPPGAYPITATLSPANELANYTVINPGGTITVLQDVQTITFPPLPTSMVYGTAPIMLSASASSKLLVGYTVTGPAALSGSMLLITGAGTVIVTATQSGNPYYSAANSVPQTITVTKAPLTVTVTNQTIPYSAALPTLSGTITGIVNGDAITAVYSTTASATSSPGTYPITATLSPPGALVNYAVNNPGGTLTVLQDTQTITFPTISAPLVYGTAPVTLTASASSKLTVAYTVMGPATLNGSILTVTGAGTVIVTATQSGNADYAAAVPVPQTVTVLQAPLLVTVANQAISYGSTIPTLTGTISGAVNADRITATYSTTANATSPPGTYPITATLSPANELVNYVVTNPGGILTIAALAQTIAFPTIPSSLVYGAMPLTLAATASSKLAVAYSVTGPASLNGSTLTITGAGTVVVTVTQPGNAEYAAATPVSQTVTVAKQPLAVKINNESVQYGMTLPTLTGTVTGIVNGDNITALYTTTGTPSSNPGTYPITATLVDPAGRLANYNVTNSPGTLTIGIDSQTITFPSIVASVVYGATPLTLTATASSQLAVVYTVTGPGALNGSILSFTGVGTVVVTATQPGSVDYLAATSVSRSIVVTKAPLTVIANSVAIAYGAVIPTLTGTITGLISGDNISATYTTTATATSNPGTYPITATLVDPAGKVANYTVTNTPGSLTIGIDSQTITFPQIPATLVYGAATVTLAATSSSQLAVIYSVTGPASLNGSVLSFTGAGTVVVTATQPGDTDYTPASPVTQSIVVGKASLTVTINNLTVPYGTVIPVLSGIISGLVTGDQITAIYATTGTATSSPGTYPITATLVDPAGRLANYNVTNSPGTLTITPPPVPTTVTYTYDSQGRLWTATYKTSSGSVTVTYTYDNAGNRTKVVIK